MKKCLIFIDKKHPKSSVDFIEAARQIFEGEPFETYGLSVNQKQAVGIGAFDRHVHITGDDEFEWNPRSLTDVLEEVHHHFQFDAIIIPATYLGRMLAPRLAMRLKVGLVADVTAISKEHGVLEMVRPAFSGKIMAGIVQQGDGPMMMTIRPNAFTYSGALTKATDEIEFNTAIQSKPGLARLQMEEKAQSYDIRDSEVLISGGAGVARRFHRLSELAEALNGEVSASRKVIDKGIAVRNIQVGQSGKTVTPRLYIALGISGAIQHIEGLRNVEYIISVNTNMNAPICSLSDVVVVGDASHFMELLIRRVTKK